MRYMKKLFSALLFWGRKIIRLRLALLPKSGIPRRIFVQARRNLLHVVEGLEHTDHLVYLSQAAEPNSTTPHSATVCLREKHS